MSFETPGIAVIDVSPLITGRGDREAVAAEIGRDCCGNGFFCISGHGIGTALQVRLEELCREFFAQDLDTKLRIPMRLGGRVWRGYFPAGDERTCGLRAILSLSPR